MVSKKRSGTDASVEGEALRDARGVLAKNQAGAFAPGREVGIKAAGDRVVDVSEVPGKHRGSSEAFYAGRRSLAYELVESGALHSSRIGLEILYLLPDGFVEAYQQLFHMALGVDDSSVMHGRSGGVEKAAGRTSMQLGTADRGGQASGSGKKWKNTPMAVRDGGAMRVKESVDKELAGLVRSISRGMAEERAKRVEGEGGAGGAGSQGPGASKGQTYRCQGTITQLEGFQDSAGPPMELVAKSRLCGRFVKVTWKFCPECGTATKVGTSSE